MGQKINPKIFRLGGVYSWNSRWFANNRRYGEFLLEDVKLREYLRKKLKIAGFLEVEIERSINKMKLTIHVSKPGIVIGRGGSGLEDMKKAIVTLKKGDKLEFLIDNKGEIVIKKTKT